MTAKSFKNFIGENIGEAVEHEETFFNGVKTVMKFTYLGDMVSAGGQCEAAVSVRARYGWAMFMECVEFM